MVIRTELDPDALAALEEQRDFLLRSLADLERELAAGDIDEADFAALEDDYTARAAEVIRSIAHRQAAFVEARPQRSRARSVGIAATVVVVAIGLGIFVARSSGRREAGDTITGDIRQDTRDQLIRAQQLFADDRLVDAISLYDTMLETQPGNVEALTYRGWLLRLAGQQISTTDDRDLLMSRSIESLDRAVAADPDYPDARVFRAMVLRDLGRPEDALADLETLAPGDVPEFMAPLVDNLRSKLTPAGTSPPGSTP